MTEVVVKTRLNNLVLVQFEGKDLEIDMHRRACEIANDHGYSAVTAWFREATAYCQPRQLAKVEAGQFVNIL